MAVNINAAWHRANPMPGKPTLDQRIAWHIAHARACGCREVPAGIAAEMKKRGIEVGTGGTASGGGAASG
jgi:hypothetical protein